MNLLINALTMSRIIFAFFIFYLISIDQYFLSLILFIVASISDYFDGYLARKYNQVSDIGEILDPIADKILVLFIFFALSVNLNSYLLAFFASVILTREIWVAALRDYNARNNNINATKVTFLAKAKTTLQMTTINLYLIGLSIDQSLILVISDIFLILTAIITIKTGHDYTRKTFGKK